MEPDQLPPPELSNETDPVEVLHAAGWIDPLGRFPIQWDKRDDFVPPRQADGWDFGDIGEDADGVWVARHPDALIAEEPELWDVLTEWAFGQREITAEDYATRSNFELEAKRALIAADQRKTRARAKRGEDEQQS